jgi:hypothetical protein
MNINYCKPKMIDLACLDKEAQSIVINEQISYHPYNILNLQLYNPIYNRLFEMNENNFSRVALDHPHHMYNLHSVTDSNQTCVINKPVFVKFSPLLDPYRYMVGKYDVNDPNILQKKRFFRKY